jgi:hypothetical protein
MNKPNFATMSTAELRAYVLEHREDEEAFHLLMDQVSALPAVEVKSMEHFKQLVQERLDKQNSQTD